MYLGPRSQRGRRIHQNHSGSISSNLKKINEGKRVENKWACKDEWRWLLDASVTAGCWCGGCDGSCAINTCASIGFSISSNSHKDCQLSDPCNIIQNHPNLSNQECPSTESNATSPVFWCCFSCVFETILDQSPVFTVRLSNLLGHCWNPCVATQPASATRFVFGIFQMWSFELLELQGLLTPFVPEGLDRNVFIPSLEWSWIHNCNRDRTLTVDWVFLFFWSRCFT